MPWVRFDDQFSIHRKVAGLSDAAFRLHVSAIFWCARNLTDGFLPEEDLDDVCARVRTPARFAAECVSRGDWHDARQPGWQPCGSDKCHGPVDKPGWVVHDYLEYQFSKEQVIRDRDAAKTRQARWKAKRNGVDNGVTNGVDNTTPPRPAPKEGGSAKADPAASARASPSGAAVAARAEHPPWCGQCDQRTRQIENDDGLPSYCPRCHRAAANGHSNGRHARQETP